MMALNALWLALIKILLKEISNLWIKLAIALKLQKLLAEDMELKDGPLAETKLLLMLNQKSYMVKLTMPTTLFYLNLLTKVQLHVKMLLRYNLKILLPLLNAWNSLCQKVISGLHGHLLTKIASVNKHCPFFLKNPQNAAQT